MTLPQRLESALMKLYKAYNDDKLHPEDSCRCAVGNILDNKDFWKHLSDDHGSIRLNTIGLLHENLGRKFQGYAPSELLQIEVAFLKGCGYSLPLHHKGRKPNQPTNPDTLFNGLSSAIEALCKMEGIDPVLEFSIQFEAVRTSKRETLEVEGSNL